MQTGYKLHFMTSFFIFISPVPHICGDKYMFASQYMRSRTARLLLERLEEEENYQAEIDKTSVSEDSNHVLSESMLVTNQLKRIQCYFY